MNAVPLEPRTLARSRQSDRQDYRSLAGASGSSRSYSRQLRRNHRLRGGGLCRGSFRGRYRLRTRYATTSAAATAAGSSWPWLTSRRIGGRLRDGLRPRDWLRRRRWSRPAARLDYWSFRWNWSWGRRSGLIIIKSRLQGLGCVRCFLRRIVSGFLAALQTVAHPFAHIACL